MLSGGACWSLWERLSVWTTLTVRVSRVLINQLNPDRADEARRAWACTYASVWPTVRIGIHTRASENTRKHNNTHQGTAHRGPSFLQCCPSCWWLGSRSCKLSQIHGWKKRGGKWKKMGRWRGGCVHYEKKVVASENSRKWEEILYYMCIKSIRERRPSCLFLV